MKSFAWASGLLTLLCIAGLAQAESPRAHPHSPIRLADHSLSPRSVAQWPHAYGHSDPCIPQGCLPPGMMMDPSLPPGQFDPDFSPAVPSPVPPGPDQPQLDLAPAQPQSQLFAASGGQQALAPNFIGDLFGSNSATRVMIQPADVVTPAETRSFSGFFTDGQGNPTTFDVFIRPDDFVELSSESPMVLTGDAVSTIPAGTAWVSRTAIAPGENGSPVSSVDLPNEFPLAENPVETSATAAAFPGAEEVIFNEGIASRDAFDEGAYNVFTDYTVVDVAERVFTPEAIFMDIPGGSLAAAPGANVGRMKLMENASPIPRDRVYVNYSYFDNTPLFPGGVNVNRVTPGFEKTFLDGNMSFELRSPFATTLDSNITQGGFTNTSNAEFGNLTMFLKAMLWSDEQFALATGLGAAVPTASDVNIRNVEGTRLVQVRNQSVHLLPFIGGVYTPTERLFVQSLMQFDVDVNGNPALVTSFDDMGTPTGEMARIGRPHDQTYMFFSVNTGYWIYLDPDGSRFITGIAPMIEYHFNQTLGRGDATRGVVDGVHWNFAAPGHLTVHNAVIGVTALIRNDAMLTLAYATPLHGRDRQFDGEFRLMFNWLFGASKPTTRLMRAATF